MKTHNLVLAAAALALAGCAVTAHTPTAATVAQIKPGVTTRADVNKLLGDPVYSFAQPSESTYEFHDAYGQDSLLVVAYDSKGVVASTFAQREEDH